ncbi:MAG: hypothetical protein PUD92_09460 [Clostridiales bacterium]|nr:hypothetical protein [Clostridiales bacterium]
MEDKELYSNYKELFDGIKASDELKSRVLARQRKKYDARPVIAAISTIAAAVAVFAAVRGYDFNHSDDGVIVETAVTETAVPQERFSVSAEQAFEASDKRTEKKEEKSVSVPEPAKSETAEKKNTSAYGETATIPEKKTVPEKKTAPENKADEYSAHNAFEGINTESALNVYTIPTPQSESNRTQTLSSSQKSDAHDNQTVSEETNGNIQKDDGGLKETEMQTRMVLQSDVAEQSNESVSSVSEDTGGSLVIPFPTGAVTLRMNSPTVLSALMYQTAEVSEDTAADETYHTEKWDNQMYFDYLGTDIINGLKLSDDMEYSGDNSYYFSVDGNGKLKNDTRIFTFTGDGGRFVSILTSRDTTFADSILSSPEVVKSSISNIQLAAFKKEQSYLFCMKSYDTAYMITTEEMDSQEIADLLFSII